MTEPVFTFECNPDRHQVARIARNGAPGEVVVYVAPRSAISNRADHEVVEIDEHNALLVVADDYVDALTRDARAEGMSVQDATQRTLRHVLGLAAKVVRNMH